MSGSNMNIILLGAPGAGKGTLAKELSGKRNFLHVSTGDIFRAEIAEKTPLGLKANEFIRKGLLVPDDLVLDLVKNRLAGEKGNKLFDGFPRTVEQAAALDSWFASRGEKIDAVLSLDVSEQAVVGRLCARRICSGCGKIYNLKTCPPKKEGFCDFCSKPLLHRKDDTPEVIVSRLQVYRFQNEPLLSYYRKAGLLTVIDGSNSPEKAFSEAEEVLFGK